MPFYEVVTPLRNGSPKPVAPGTIVEMDAGEARALVRVGAIIDRNERPIVIFAEQPGQVAAVLSAEGGIEPAVELSDVDMPDQVAAHEAAGAESVADLTETAETELTAETPAPQPKAGKARR